MNGRTAQITVEPTAPATIGPGAFTGAVAVTGYTCADPTCSKLSAGSTSTVAVNYQVSPAVQLVAPVCGHLPAFRTASSSAASASGASTFTGVRFGDTAATAFTCFECDGISRDASGPHGGHVYRSSRLLESPGRHSIERDAGGAVDPVAYAATTTLTYPVATTDARRLVYDAERRALVLVTDAAGSPIIRYAYDNGAWSAPVNVAGRCRDAALSTDGTQLYGITSTAVTPIDPITLALGTAVTAPSPPANSSLKNIVVGNDDRALITNGIASSTATAGYLYDPVTAAVVSNGVALNNATPTMAANGATAIVSQGDPTLTADIACLHLFRLQRFAGNYVSIAAAELRRASRRSLRNARHAEWHCVCMAWSATICRCSAHCRIPPRRS